MAGPYRPKPTYKPGGRRPDPRQQKKDEDGLNINGQITAPQVRLVGDNIPEPGIWPLAKAMQLADQLELDLQGYTKGVYTVSILSKGKTLTRKVVVE